MIAFLKPVKLFSCKCYIFHLKCLWCDGEIYRINVNIVLIFFHSFASTWRTHNWSLNIRDLNCRRPLTHKFFSGVNITVMYVPRLVESGDVAPRIWGPTIQLYTDFLLHGKSTHLTTTLLKGQLDILFFVELFFLINITYLEPSWCHSKSEQKHVDSHIHTPCPYRHSPHYQHRSSRGCVTEY